MQTQFEILDSSFLMLLLAKT